MKMAPPNILVLSVIAFIFLVGSEAQQTFQFSSFSQIPQSLLNQLGSAQIENLKQTLNGGGGGGGNGVPTYQVPSPQGGGGGGGQPAQQQTLQFSSFSQIPQSVLDALPSAEVEQIKKALQGNGGGGVQTYQIPGQQGGGQPNQQGGGQPTQQTFQFSSFSQIPQSLLDQLTSSQISNIKRELTPQPVQTYQIPGQQGGGQPTQQTFQFSSFSQIPQSLLDQLTSSQISNIKRELTPQPAQTYQIPGRPQNTQTLQFSRFSQIPQSVLDQFTSDQIQQIKLALQQGGGTVQLPATVTSYSYTIGGGNNKRITNILNILFNYVAVGGYLTGVPPIDLMLIRFYINMGPDKFC